MKTLACSALRAWLTAVLIVTLGSLACADEAADRGRAVMDKWEQAVVSIRLTVKMRMSSEGRQLNEEESTQEIRATVIDPSGLAVCSLAEADPSHIFAAFMQEEGYQWEVDITGVKMRLPDGKEIPAKVVLRDRDLDLAFVRPEEKLAQPLAAVDLKEAADAQVLDEIVLVGRLSEAANRIAYVALDRISAIMQKPRKLYVPGISGHNFEKGSPVFTPNGKIVGILLNRLVASPGGGMANGPQWVAVVLPAADVAEVAQQAIEM